MSGQLPNGTHINPKFAQKVHINPKFVKNEEKCNSSVHVNPNFAKRALPPIPKAAETSPKKASNPKAHLNPNFISEYKMAIEGKIHVNPNFPVPKISPTSALEKENIKTPKTGSMKTPMNTFSSATKTLFKKFGNRKLVRVKASQETPKTFTKIGMCQIYFFPYLSDINFFFYRNEKIDQNRISQSKKSGITEDNPTFT